MKIMGERVIIRPTEEEDLNSIRKLWNDGRVMKWVGFPDGLNNSRTDMQKWYSKIQDNKLANHFVILNKEKNFCGELFYRKDPDQIRAGLDIKLLPEAQGKGLAAEALQLLIDHIFTTEEEIDAVWTEPAAVNSAARRLYTRCGLEEKERPDDLGPGDSYWELTREKWS